MIYIKIKYIIVAVLVITNSLNIEREVQEVDYNRQVQALKQSFDEKKPDAIKPFISDSLSFGTFPAGATMQILGQVFNNLPKLNSLKVLSQRKGEVSLAYDFITLGKRESKLLLDDEGKITKLELVENLVNEEIEARKAMAAQVQAPVPGELAEKYPAVRVEIKAKDGQPVVGNLYDVGEDRPVILLCHQAGYNKHEYVGIAPKLNAMGFNVLAIDQRSGGPLAGYQNETAKMAEAKGIEAKMVDAEPDLEGAVDYLSNRYKRKVTLWGSSYSSSLALFVGMNNSNVKAVISFSPGDYFGETKESLAEVFKTLKKPFLVTSSKAEATSLAALLKGVSLNETQSQFIPEGNGYHGSRALWEGQKGGEEYWAAVRNFLSKVYPD